MRITRNRGMIALGVVALMLAGCASDPAEDQTATDTGSDATMTDNSSANTDAAMEPAAAVGPRVTSDGGIVVATMAGDGTTEALELTFYFDFDQAIVKRSGHSELDKHAHALIQDRSIRVRIEGHADERGTREYNLALGERRANAIRAYLVAQGVSRSQIEVISYGEEKPAILGSSESARAQNRRVQFNYR